MRRACKNRVLNSRVKLIWKGRRGKDGIELAVFALVAYNLAELETNRVFIWFLSGLLIHDSMTTSGCTFKWRPCRKKQPGKETKCSTCKLGSSNFRLLDHFPCAKLFGLVWAEFMSRAEIRLYKWTNTANSLRLELQAPTNGWGRMQQSDAERMKTLRNCWLLLSIHHQHTNPSWVNAQINLLSTHGMHVYNWYIPLTIKHSHPSRICNHMYFKYQASILLYAVKDKPKTLTTFQDYYLTSFIKFLQLHDHFDDIAIIEGTNSDSRGIWGNWLLRNKKSQNWT